jgi:hypothetical protein
MLVVLCSRGVAVDPALLPAMSLMTVRIGMVASYLPGRWASSVDALESMRSE